MTMGNQQDNQQGNQQGDTTGADAGKQYTPPATQADLDRIIEARLARERTKFDGFDEFKAKAEKFDAAEAANKTELQKSQDAANAAEKRAGDAEAKLLRAEVASEKGVPAALLSGATRADLEAAADALLAFKGKTPTAPAPEGGGDDVHDKDEKSAADVVKAALGR